MRILGLSLLLVLRNQSVSGSRVRFDPNAKVMYFGSDNGDDTTVASAVADCRYTTMRGPYSQSCASLALVRVLNAWKPKIDRIFHMTTVLYGEFNTPAFKQAGGAADRRTLEQMGEATKEVGNLHKKMQILYDTKIDAGDINATVLWSLITKLISIIHSMQHATINIMKLARRTLYTSHFTTSANKSYLEYMKATDACFAFIYKRIAEAMEDREDELVMRDLKVED